MTNNNTQAPIPLRGRGFTIKNKGNYKPGEYRQLSNVVFTDDGELVDRPNVGFAGDTLTTVNNPQGIIGHVADNVVVSSATSQKVYTSSAANSLWNPTSLPVPVGVNSFHKILKVFKYNNRTYWLTLEYDAVGNTLKFCSYWVDAGYNDLTTIAFAGLTRTVLITISTVYSYPVYICAFMHKDRLWIVTDKTVYFSKATDPLVFSVPDGGFLNTPDSTIRHSFALNDTVYILCDGQTLAYTYSVTPDDGYMRAVSKDTGGMWGVAHKNTPYMINNDGLYVLSNGNVEKVLSSNFENPSVSGSNNSFFKIESFGDYIYIVRRTYINYANIASNDIRYYNNGGYVYNYLTDTDAFGSPIYFNYNVFMFNPDQGTLVSLDFTDRNDVVSPVGRGYITDVYANAEKDFFGYNNVFFLTTGITNSPTLPITSIGKLYKMSNAKSAFLLDESIDSTANPKRYKHRIVVEIEGFSPDSSEYLNKKFRYLEGMAKLPGSDFQVQVALEDNAYRNPISIVNVNYANQKLHSPFKIPINQRASAISIKFSCANPLTSFVSPTVYDQFQLSDLRLLWSYTDRSRVHPSLTAANSGKNY